MIGHQVPGDLALSADGRELVITSGAALAEQQIRAGAEIWQGSLSWDPFAGLPMLQSILVKGPDFRLITQVFRQFLLDTAAVTTVDSLLVSLDRPTRTLTVTFRVTCEDGQGVSDELQFALA
jgi:hypothetical protein